MKSFSKIRKGSALILPLAAFSFLGVLVAQEPRREQDKNATPTVRPVNERPTEKSPRDGGRDAAPANPAREGEKGNREGRRAEAGSDAKERLLNGLNLSKDERAKVESILAAREEKMREIQQSTMKAIRDAIGEEKFQSFIKNSTMPNRGASPANPPREGDRGAKPEAGRPEGDRKPGANPPREGDRGAKPEAGRPEGERKAGAVNPAREGDRGAKPEAGRPEGDRKPGANPPREGDRGAKPEAGRPEGDRKPGANPPREGDRGAKPEAGRPEGDRKGGPGAGPEARERILNELNLSKDVRAKVEAILSSQQEKMKDIIAKGKEGNGDREKIMAEVREMQQAMVKNLKEIMGEDKFRMFIKNAPMFIRGAGPDGTPKRGDGQGRDSSRQKE